MFTDGKYLSLNIKNKQKKNTKCFYRNGPSILITKIKNITKTNIYENGKIINFTMKQNKSIDINTPTDFKKLTKIFNLKKNILIYGAGNIAIRHVQSIIYENSVSKIFVFDKKKHH